MAARKGASAPTKATKPKASVPTPKPAKEARVKAQAAEVAASTRKAVVDRERYQYSKSGAKTASGRPAVDNGDPVAVALRGKTVDQVVELITENGLEPNPSWNSLANIGLVRMAAGNRLRSVMRNAGFIRIGGKKVKAPTPAVEEQRAA